MKVLVRKYDNTELITQVTSLIQRRAQDHSDNQTGTIEQLESRVNNLDELVAKLIEQLKQPAKFIKDELVPGEYDFIKIIN